MNTKAIINLLDEELLNTQSPYFSVQKANKLINEKGLNKENTPNLIGKMIQEGLIPHSYRVGTQWRIPISDTDKLPIAENIEKDELPPIEIKFKDKKEKTSPPFKTYLWIGIISLCAWSYCNKSSDSSVNNSTTPHSNNTNTNDDLQQAVNDMVTIYWKTDDNSSKEVTQEEAKRVFTIRMKQILSVYPNITASRIADKVVYAWQKTRSESVYNGSLYTFFNNFGGAIRANHKDKVDIPFDESLVIYYTLILETQQ
jgi:hypothetical protein